MSTPPSSAAAAPAIGDVIRVDDRITRFSKKKRNRMRWCMVAAVFGPHVRVVGRTATGRSGVFTPALTLPQFDRDGYFWPGSARIPLSIAAGCRNIGQLPEPYRSQVLAQTRRRRGGRP